MKPVFIRPMRAEETKQYLEWARANRERSEFDPAVGGFPSTLIPCVYDFDGPLGYMPVQHPYMLDAFAPRPGLSKLRSSQVLKEIVQWAVTTAHENGVGEILFFATDEDTVKFAERQQIFHEVPYKVYRVKVAELEPRPKQE